MMLHQEFLRIAKSNPNRLFIIDRTMNRRLTFSRALIAALILMRKLRAYPDRYIGIMIPNSAGSILAIIAGLLAGKIPVMINYATGAAVNAEYAQSKCGFSTIITSRGLVERLGCRIVHGMIFLEDIMAGIGVADKLLGAVTAHLPLPILKRMAHGGSEDDTVVILFTSGSEKDPKAVQLTHRNISSNVNDVGRVLILTPDDIILANLPYFHVFGHNINFWLPICNTMTIVTTANPLEYRTVCSIIREEKISVMVGTPIFFAGYLRQSEKGDFDTVRIMVAGADKVPDSLRQGFLAKQGKELCEGYGTTETSPVVSVNLPGANKPGSIGRILPNVKVKIVDVATGEELPAGKEGKILVKGDLVMKGYLNDPEQTAERIKDGWYETGDMGMMDEDGYLWHRGRLKRFVKIGGEMVSLVSVENVLAALIHEDIDICVVEVPDPLKGARIVAAVTRPVDEKFILRKMAEKLPPIALPKEFIVIDELPKMGSGKIDFRKVTAMVSERPGAGGRPS